MGAYGVRAETGDAISRVWFPWKNRALLLHASSRTRVCLAKLRK